MDTLRRYRFIQSIGGDEFVIVVKHQLDGQIAEIVSPRFQFYFERYE